MFKVFVILVEWVQALVKAYQDGKLRDEGRVDAEVKHEETVKADAVVADGVRADVDQRAHDDPGSLRAPDEFEQPGDLDHAAG